MRPEVEQRFDVVVERVRGCGVQHLMGEDVALQLADEEQRQRARIAAADRSRFHGAAEVIGEEPQGAARRNLFVVRIEGNDDRRRVHLHGDGGTQDGADEGNGLPREVAEDDARVRRRIRPGQRQHEVGHGNVARAHRRAEELLLGIEMAQDRRRRDAQLAGDVGERRGREAARAECAARGIEDLIARNARRTAHGISKRMFTNRYLSTVVY